MYKLASFRPKSSNRSRSRHRLASEADSQSGIERGPILDSDKDAAENNPCQKSTFTGYVNSPEDIAAFHKHKIPLRTIVKDLSLPAPVPTRPSPYYIYGDMSMQAYPPPSKKISPISIEPRRRGRTVLRADIQKLLRGDRDALKSNVALTFARLLNDRNDEDEIDVFKLFAHRRGTALLPTVLATGMLFMQNADEEWRANLRASQNSASGIKSRAKYIGGFRNRAFYIRPGPSALGNEVFAADTKNENDKDAAAVSLHGRSESESSTGTTSSEETLVDAEVTGRLFAQLKECKIDDGITIRNVKARCAVEVVGSPITAQSAAVRYIIADEVHPEMSAEVVHAPTLPRDEVNYHPLTRTTPHKPRKRSTRV